MNFTIVRDNVLSGSKATIYSVIVGDDEESETLLERFIEENRHNHGEEVRNILQRLNSIGHTTGARDVFFKHWEGVPGDGVCALYDDPDKKLRLYCIRFGAAVLVVGGGGPKPKNLRALQESQKLKTENEIMKIVSEAIATRIKERDIYWAPDGSELFGDFNFYDND